MQHHFGAGTKFSADFSLVYFIINNKKTHKKQVCKLNVVSSHSKFRYYCNLYKQFCLKNVMRYINAILLGGSLTIEQGNSMLWSLKSFWQCINSFAGWLCPIVVGLFKFYLLKVHFFPNSTHSTQYRVQFSPRESLHFEKILIFWYLWNGGLE